MDENKFKKMIIISVILMLLILALIIYGLLKDEGKNKKENIVQLSNSITNEIVPDVIAASIDQFEGNRINLYLDNYLSCIEEKNYEKAYSFLHDDFKQAHYPTIEKYKEYVEKKYFVNNIISHEGYDKLGQYHILTVKFSDILNATQTTIPTFIQKFIIVENGLNDFELSFQAE